MRPITSIKNKKSKQKGKRNRKIVVYQKEKGKESKSDQ